MNVLSRLQALTGERIVGVEPPMAPQLEGTWHRRLNLYTGRALSDLALTLEQTGRAGRLATRGQMVSPGVVTGLEIGVEHEVRRLPDTGDTEDVYYYHIAAGLGLAASGEDVVVPKDLRIEIAALPVFATVELLDRAQTQPGSGESPAIPETSATGALQARKLGPPLKQLIERFKAEPTIVPRTGIVVLQPVTTELIGRFDPEDQCERDPANDAYEDWQIADAARLVFYLWPTEWLPLPAGNDRRRNRLAYTIFEAEARHGPDDLFPWEEVGVPIALVDFDEQWEPQFIDRYAVVRAGGKPKQRTMLIPGAGNAFVWQARMQQFAAQLADEVAQQLADSARDGIDINAIARQFRFVPPAGLLPADAIDARSQLDRFFPSSFVAEATPVPLEQLDVALEASASLAPFDTFSPDQVRILVPVPQVWYEPTLLQVEAIDPEIPQTVERFVAERTEWLVRRDNVRRKQAAITAAITGERPGNPPAEADPGRLEPEDAILAVPFSSTAAHQTPVLGGTHQHLFTGATPPFAIAADDTLTAYVYLDAENPPRQIMLQWNDGTWEHRAYWGANIVSWGMDGTASRRYMGELPTLGEWVRLEVPAAQVDLVDHVINGMAFTLFDGRAAWAHAGKSAKATPLRENDIVWVGNELPAGATPHGDADGWNWITGDEILTPFEEQYDTQLSDGVRVATAVARLKTQLVGKKLRPEEIAKLDELGLKEFIEFLDDKVRRSDDTIDFGFARVQTDIYRLRQFVLGDAAATRLATSPALASIAQGEVASATREDLAAFLQRIKNRPVNPFENNAPTREGSTPPPDGPGATARGGGTSAFVAGNTFVSGATRPRPATFTEPASFQRPTTRPVGGIGGADLTAGIKVPGAASMFDDFLDKQGSLQVDAVAAELVKRETALPDRVIVKPPTKEQVFEQSPIIGATLDLRTTTVAQRFKDPPAKEAKDYGVASKYEVISGLASLPIAIDDLPVPGFRDAEGKEVEHNFKTIKEQKLADAILTGDHDKNLKNGTDEAAFFASSVRAIDNAVGAMRVVEGRVQLYRSAVQLCRQVLSELQALASRITNRLNVIADHLAEARHDVAVARALLAEEQARIAAINKRRDQIIAEQVTFIAFHRPRATDLLVSAPVRALDPGLQPAPVPACLANDVAVPPELRTIVDLLREVPGKWFMDFPPLLDKLDRLETLLGTLQSAKLRAAVQFPAQRAVTQPELSRTKLGQAIANVFVTQQQTVAQYRGQTAAFNLGALSGQSWKLSREQANALVSLGDLIDANHGRADISQAATRNLNEIAQVAACLYGLFGEVRPGIRLDWAERLSQHDAPVNLRNLASLPRWGEIEQQDRREMQSLVDWLYQRIDVRQPEANDLMHDLIRVCILLASHAPVNQIIAGRVPQPTPVNLGGRVDLLVDVSKVRVGMHVLMYAGSKVVARGVVEDLGGGKAAARVVQTETATVQLDRDAHVQFAEPAAFERNPLTARKAVGHASTVQTRHRH